VQVAERQVGEMLLDIDVGPVDGRLRALGSTSRPLAGGGPGVQTAQVMTTFRTATCPTCSSVVADGDRFCKQCGTEVSGISASMFSGPGAAGPNTPAGVGLPAGSPWEQVLLRLRAVTAGEFEVGRELGRGGMAAVFLAQDLALNRRVAIKVMAPGLMMGDDMIQRFRREAITIANLQHAHIVTVHAVRQMADLHFFVMQFVEGQSLDGVLRSRGALPSALVLPMLHQVGSALAYAHRRGVIHRDIKPGNILLSADGDALVTDFGIAKVAEGPAQTQTGMVVGTPSYMSPEQCFATELDGASDQYSLGIVAYQMLCGRVPFIGGTFEIMKGHTTEPVPPMRDFAPDVPARVESAILRMLAKKPSDRFASFGEALAAMGAEPLGEHSPLRAEMIRLAAVEERREALGDLLRTPSGPVSGARSGARAAPTPRTPAPATAVAVAIAPIASDIEVGETITLRASVRGAEASMLEWRTDTPSIVQVDASTGALQALAEGEAVVIARVGTVDEHLSLRIVAPQVASLRVTPVNRDVRVGDSLVLTAEALDRRDRPLSRPVTWRAAGSAAVIDEAGVVHARAVGRSDLTVTCEHISETVILQVLPALAARVEIVAPTDHLEVGHAVTLSAVVYDAHGTRLTDRALQWSVDRPERARIDAAGVLSLLGDGAIVVRAVCERVESTCALTIAPARAVSVSITGVPALLRDGDRFTLTATPRDVRGTALTRAVTWRSSQPTVATVDTSGAVHARTAGAADITATIDGVSASVSLVVHVTPPQFAASAAASDRVSTPASATAVLPGLDATKNRVVEPRLPVASTESASPAAAPQQANAPAASPAASSMAGASPSQTATETRTAGDSAPSRGRPAWIYGVAVVPVALVIWMLTRGGPTESSVADTTGTGAPEQASGQTGTPPEPDDPARIAAAAESAAALAARDSAEKEALARAAGGTSGGTTTGNGASVLRVPTPPKTTLKVAESITLQATIADRTTGRSTRGPAITFRTSNRAVAQVDAKGVVTAVAPGTVRITVDAGDAGRSTIALTIAAAEVAARPGIDLPVAPPKPTVVTTNPSKNDSVPAVNPSAPVPVAVSQLQLASEARKAVEEYFRALESMDIARVRAVYPGISPSYAAEIADMFKFSKSVQFTVKSVNLSNGSGSYDAVVGSRTDVRVGVRISLTPSSRAVKAPPPKDETWPITLRREASGWRIEQIIGQ
jgi:eukaryotic-like serine/threonine-protein kinase